MSKPILSLVPVATLSQKTKKPDRCTAYTVAPEPFFMDDMEGEPFAVKHSANAWWMNRVKVYALLVAFRFGATIKEACEFSGISKEQWQYFNEVHPDFYLLKERIGVVIGLRALKILNKYVTEEHETKKERGLACRVAMWWLSRRDPARWGSAAERLYWAKQALQDVDNVDQRRHNIESASELLEYGRSIIQIKGDVPPRQPVRRKRELPLQPTWAVPGL